MNNRWIQNRYAQEDPNTVVIDRTRVAFNLMRTLHLAPGSRILDVGCRTGTITHGIAALFPQAQIYGLDLSWEALRQLQQRDITGVCANLDGMKLPLQEARFDLIFAGEILEHLFDTDLFLQELCRILKPCGHLVLSTPNLACWHNRFIFLPLGWQPSMSECSIRRHYGRPFRSSGTPPGHIHLFVPRSLKEMLAQAGFLLCRMRGSMIAETFLAGLVDRFISHTVPSLAAEMVILARKP